MHHPARFRATVVLTSTTDGGRQKPITNGFRSALFEVSKGGLAGATLELLDADELPPGTTGTALVRPFYNEYWTHLVVGDVLTLTEGPRMIGTAEILEVL